MTPIIGHIKSRETVPLSGKESRKEKAQLRARPVWRVAVLASLLCYMVYHYTVVQNPVSFQNLPATVGTKLFEFVFSPKSIFVFAIIVTKVPKRLVFLKQNYEIFAIIMSQPYCRC